MNKHFGTPAGYDKDYPVTNYDLISTNFDYDDLKHLFPNMPMPKTKEELCISQIKE